MHGDLDLLERWRGGDARAGEALFRRHFSDVFRFFEGKLGAGARADDLTQQTFLECVRSKDVFRGEATFRTYLFAIAWNQLRHHFRSSLKDERIDFDVTSLDALEASITSAGTRLDRARRRERLHRALSTLPASQQTLLELHYWHGLDGAELAVVFDIPPGTVRVRLLRARRALRQALQATPALGADGDESDPISISLAETARADSDEDEA